MVDDTNVRTGQCHCGTVRFEATLVDGLNSALRCTCSYCRMRGAVVVMAEMGGVKNPAGRGCADDLSLSYRRGAALLLLALWHLHPPSTTIEPKPVRRQRRVPRWREPVRFSGSAGHRWRQSHQRHRPADAPRRHAALYSGGRVARMSVSDMRDRRSRISQTLMQATRLMRATIPQSAMLIFASVITLVQRSTSLATRFLR